MKRLLVGTLLAQMIKPALRWWLSFGAADDTIVTLDIGSTYNVKVTLLRRTSAGQLPKPVQVNTLVANSLVTFKLTQYESIVIERIDSVSRTMRDLPKSTSEGHE